MQPIDRPFRFSLDFCVVWALLAVPTYLLTRQWGLWDSIWTHCVFLALLSLFETFVLYGSVMLVCQIKQSGSRGRLVARVFLSILLAVAILFAGLVMSGHYTSDSLGIVAFLVSGMAGAYLHWKTDKGDDSSNK